LTRRRHPLVTGAYPGRVSEDGRSSAMPILIAAGVVALVLLASVLLRMTRGEEITAEAGIGRAVVGQNDALQRGSYPDFLRYTCAAEQGTEAGVLEAQRRSAAAKGARIVEDVGGFAIDADRASATVTYRFEKAAEEKISTPMTFVREGGEWKVCSPGPG
jgi:hypothetical protein